MVTTIGVADFNHDEDDKDSDEEDDHDQDEDDNQVVRMIMTTMLWSRRGNGGW